jgi:S-DNA-T family DNA segregation ATPase FtsK/SpoIIIE
MVELTIYNGIPHLMTPVVTDSRKASIVLRWMVTEMEKRYRAFADLGVRDIYKYNVTAKEKLPFIVIIIDELADLMTVAPVEVEDSICRLAQMARAAGMHLVVATQRPSVDVVTGIIKANIPSRIAFAVSSQADSRTIIDMGGAEKLLGKGDMLFFPVGSSKPFRVQGTFVSDSDIEQTVAFILDQATNKEDKDEFKEAEFSLQQADELEENDDLFWEAVQLFVDTQKASVSLLQRKLRVGYARAARLVDMMEDRGIVSEMDNNKKREVLIDSTQLEKLYSNHDLI